MPRILIAVTHLLGSGHLVRARHLARALAGAGHEVTLASGGMPLATRQDEPFAFVQLPPVKVEGVDFRNLLDEAGQPIGSERRATRQAMLSSLATSLRPDIVVTEHFPFGRRQLAGEFMELIAAAKAANPQLLVLSSIRDVLVAPRTERIAEAEQRIASHFDGVLVHGDAAFLPLEASWPASPELAGRLHYTGYLADAAAKVAAIDHGEIIVSGGGSAAALPLFELCVAAAGLLGQARGWRILVGRGVSEAAFAGLRDSAPAHVIVEWARPDFPALLAGCALSISQAGYNTVLDLVAAGRPALVVPFDAGNETEQAIRAEAMDRAGLARCLRLDGETPLTPRLLKQAVESMLTDAPERSVTIDRSGGAAVCGIVARLLGGRG
ncbi:glycosyltransferase family protein [Bosea psychrotolerans]|uniref:Putative glycosyltransferase n=1 Tax=Bosea psychrotolerans TaxID=1871628 RepID=A0A2S4MAS9_9HYPH|nr:glycosyltransferase [Bosea psychrotolerans]POR51745.1 putative glycosyltransferase [Bosea psychrotolerans]